MMLYIHIPFCIRKCLYCDFLSFMADEKSQTLYMNALLREMEYYGRQLNNEKIETVFIGGGTPSILQPGEIERMLEGIFRNFDVIQDAEISMECNPGTLTKEKLEIMKSGGINRISIGLQSMNDEELKTLGRIHDTQTFYDSFFMAREAGFDNINIDIMSALPGQTKESFEETLKKVVELNPEHISAYSLIIEEGTPFYEKYEKDVECREKGLKTKFLPDEDTEYDILKFTQRYLSEHGYERYEVSNFAKQGYECRHNSGYWTRKEYVGMGLGASSLYKERRMKNLSNLNEYIDCWSEFSLYMEGFEPDYEESYALSKEESMEETMFLGLRMVDGVRCSSFEKEFGLKIDDVYSKQIKELLEEGLINTQSGYIRLTDKGFDVGNYVFAKFLLV